MATKKRSKGGRAAGSRAQSSARPRAVGRKAKPVAKPKRATKARAAKPTPAKKPPAPKRGAAENKEMVALKARFQRERSALEKNLTEAVREIGLLRHHEMRVVQLERQVKERDDLIGRLQQQLDELQRRSIEPIYEREVQQSFTLIASSRDDVDEFTLSGASGEEAPLVDETELEDEEA